jgi:hypothetical protein
MLGRIKLADAADYDDSTSANDRVGLVAEAAVTDSIPIWAQVLIIARRSDG